VTDRDVLRLLCFGFDGTIVPDHLREFLGQGLGGVILFKRNLHDVEQICALTAALHGCASHPLLVGVDQEGGRVTRLPAPFWSPPPAAALGRADDPSLTYETARAIGRELRAAGFNWNLAPVLDVHTNPTNPIIGDRAFSSDPQRVARLGLLAMRGLADAGLVTTGKHFPGHGETSTDSHRTLPESPQTTDRWRTVEFVPFRAAIRAGIPSVLVAHLDCPALDPAAPSSLSRVIVTDILRGELGFDGVVVSDDLEMGAVTERHEIGEATVRFIEAGGDLALICRSLAPQREAVAALQSAVRRGRLSRHRIQASLDRLSRFHNRITPETLAISAETVRAIVSAPERETLVARIRTGEVIPAGPSDGATPPSKPA
jgi:beta-N-acetylhexosaminidase